MIWSGPVRTGGRLQRFQFACSQYTQLNTTDNSQSQRLEFCATEGWSLFLQRQS